MKDKASGNDGADTENSEAEIDEEPGIHVGDELAMDPDAGDLLDPMEDRWWNEEPEEKTPQVDPPEALGSEEEKLNQETDPDSSAEETEGTGELDDLLPPVRKKRSFKTSPREKESIQPALEKLGDEDEDEEDGKPEERDVAEEPDLKTGPALVIAEENNSESVTESEKPEPEEKIEEPDSEDDVEVLPKLEKKVVAAPVLARKKKKVAPILKTKTDRETAKSEAETLQREDEKEPESEPEKESEEIEPPESEESNPETETRNADLPSSGEKEAARDKSDEDETEENETEENETEENETEEEDKSLLQVMNENQAPVDLASAATSYASARPKAGCWTIFATLFFFASLLLLVVVGIGAVIAWSKMGDLEREIDTFAKGKLEQQGVFLDYEDWEWAFPRGVVLQNVTVYESAERTTPIVQASDIGVNVDVVGLARDRNSLSGAELSLADSNLSFFEDGNSVVDLQNIDGEILVDREQIRVERFDAEIGGLRIVATGSVDLPEKSSGGGSGGGGDSPAERKPFAIDITPLKEALKMLAIETDGTKPVLSVEFTVGEGKGHSEIDAVLSGNDFTWHGVPVTSATAACSLDPASNTLKFSNFQIGHGEGFVGGVFTVAIAEKRVDIERAQSSVDLLALYTSLKPETADKWSKLAFADAPNVQFSGTVPLDSPGSAKLAIDYQHRKGLIYKAEQGDLPITGIRGHIDLNDGRLETNDLAADILDGQIALNGTVNLGTEGTPFSGLVEIAKLPLANASAYFGKEKIGMSGDLYMTFRGVGYSDVERIRGGGDIRVEQATLPAFPVVGPVQEMLGRVIPAFRFEEAGSVTGSYLIESGILLTNNFTITNNSANLLVNGSVKLAQQTTDFTAVASLNEPLAKATGLEGKTVEVRGTGPLTEPKLTLRDFPVEFAGTNLNDILGTSPETLGTLSQILAGQDNAAEVITGSIEEATGVELGETVGALLEGLISPPTEKDTEEPAEPEPEPEPEPAKPVIRATVVEPE